MGHKSIVVIDMDHLDVMVKNPEAFVQALKQQILTHKRTGGDVNCGGTTVANVIHPTFCLVSEKPTFKFVDFDGVIQQ